MLQTLQKKKKKTVKNKRTFALMVLCLGQALSRNHARRTNRNTRTVLIHRTGQDWTQHKIQINRFSLFTVHSHIEIGFWVQFSLFIYFSLMLHYAWLQSVIFRLKAAEIAEIFSTGRSQIEFSCVHFNFFSRTK